MTAHLLEARQLTIGYRQVGPAPLVEGLDLVVGTGTVVQLDGPSGTGKSSVLRVLAALQQPAAGQVLLHGRDVARLSPRSKASLRSHEIGYLAQSPRLIPEFDVEGNVALPAVLGGMGRRRGRAVARILLERLGVAHRARHRAWEVSGGELQRVAVARALVTSPSLLFLDEPFTDLDDANVEVVTALVGEHVAQGAAVVLASHVTVPAQLAAHQVAIGPMPTPAEARPCR